MPCASCARSAADLKLQEALTVKNILMLLSKSGRTNRLEEMSIHAWVHLLNGFAETAFRLRQAVLQKRGVDPPFILLRFCAGGVCE